MEDVQRRVEVTCTDCNNMHFSPAMWHHFFRCRCRSSATDQNSCVQHAQQEQPDRPAPPTLVPVSLVGVFGDFAVEADAEKPCQPHAKPMALHPISYSQGYMNLI